MKPSTLEDEIFSSGKIRMFLLFLKTALAAFPDDLFASLFKMEANLFMEITAPSADTAIVYDAIAVPWKHETVVPLIKMLTWKIS